MFTDLTGSTAMYVRMGDAPAYGLVRAHFAYLAERVSRHGGFIVKTVGDAVMAAFHDPAEAVRAALSMQDDLPGFNEGRTDRVILKLGLHQGPCVAVTAGGVLDYFGSTVNTAARLEHHCKGGEVVISAAVLADADAAAALAGRRVGEESAELRGLSEPVRCVRVAAT
jgi:class 3 adenylate cyclase